MQPGRPTFRTNKEKGETSMAYAAPAILMIDERPVAHAAEPEELIAIVEEMYVPGIWRDMYDVSDGGRGRERASLDDWREISDVHGGIISLEEYPVDPDDGHDVLIEILTTAFYAYNYSAEPRAEIEDYCRENGITIE